MLSIVIAVIPAILLFLSSILFLILGERRVLAEVQEREGPSVTGAAGFLQALLDGTKTFFKSIMVSRRAYKVLFFILPVCLLISSITKFVMLPWSENSGLADFDYDILMLNLWNAAEIFIFVFSTWAVFSSKFPTLAALREVAQQCAVEALMGICLVVVVMYSGTLSLRGVVGAQECMWYLFVISPYAYIYYLAVLAELHRTPTDLTEAESELTAGYQAEHGGILFSLFYLSEYGSITVSAIVFSLLFLGGWFFPWGVGMHWVLMLLKVISFAWLVVITRATLPRVRVRALSSVVWSHLIPFSASALPNYLWYGIMTGAFRICEYVVFGIEKFKSVIRRAYYLSLNFWARLSWTVDNRVDTAMWGFLWARKYPEIWTPYTAPIYGNGRIIGLRHPEDRVMGDALLLAGGLVLEGERHLAQPFNVDGPEISEFIVLPRGKDRSWYEYTAISQAKLDAMYWQELLAGNLPEFLQQMRFLPDREVVSDHFYKHVKFNEWSLAGSGVPWVEADLASASTLGETGFGAMIPMQEFAYYNSDLSDAETTQLARGLEAALGKLLYTGIANNMDEALGLDPAGRAEDLAMRREDMRILEQTIGARHMADVATSLIFEETGAGRDPADTLTPKDLREATPQALGGGVVHGTIERLESPTGFAELAPLLGGTYAMLERPESEIYENAYRMAEENLERTINSDVDVSYRSPYFDPIATAASFVDFCREPMTRDVGLKYWALFGSNMMLPRNVYRQHDKGIAEILSANEYEMLRGSDLQKIYSAAAFSNERWFNTERMPGPAWAANYKETPNNPYRRVEDFHSGPSGRYGYDYAQSCNKTYYPIEFVVRPLCPDQAAKNMSAQYYLRAAKPWAALSDPNLKLVDSVGGEWVELPKNQVRRQRRV